jgi:hypothetical protein
MPERNRRIGRNTLLLEMNQSCAGVERAEMSVSSPTEEVATVSADEHLGPYLGQCGDYRSLMSVRESTEMTTRIRNRFTHPESLRSRWRRQDSPAEPFPVSFVTLGRLSHGQSR